MRFMIIVKATRDSEAGVMPEDALIALIAQMGKYHEELAQASMLVDGAGLKASSHGWRIQYSGDKRTYVDGPFTETKELVAGYTLIQAKSREEAIEWTKRFPNPSHFNGEAQIEVRQLFSPEDFEPSAAVDRIKALDMPSQQPSA